ncbi:hypothetical protein TUM17379_11660 [Shewanella algae]|uniref:Uncharacterized protein n=1 Tax=Shewanella algae TaxID=38313 RepID=A0AAD1NLL2_9GAMM|nr:hypothetical protein TUM17379_11660 [Shewanella algae]
MEFSKKNDSGDTIYHISKLNKSDNGTLNCRYCGTDVQYVSAYTRGGVEYACCGIFKAMARR